jgi:hypothetical protein
MSELGSHLHIPVRVARDIIPFLGKGKLHWREGYSAHALATTWCMKAGLPPSVRRMLDGTEVFAGAELVDGFFERETDLKDGLPRASQTDLLAIIRIQSGLAVLAVEGKVEEPFGQLIGDQRQLSAGQKKRLSGLQALFDVPDRALADLRYQLFHRAAATIFEAQRYACRNALLLVHSFSTNLTGHSDFSAFASAIGLGATAPMTVIGPKAVNGVSLYAGWLTDPVPGVPQQNPLARCVGDLALWLKRRYCAASRER